ncbi:MAG: hypothetical protein H0W04_01975 [Chthoniobacterales bacterium]|nr:hypothetical protein [Chthoniobacterales bacterium]
MKISIRFLSFCFVLAAAGSAFAGSDGTPPARNDIAPSETRASIPFEFDLEYAYIGDSEVKRSFRRVDFDEHYGLARLIYTPRLKFGILRLGGSYERFEFGVPNISLLRQPPGGGQFFGSPQIPRTLQTVSAIVGLDTQFSDSLLFRFEAQPGLFGTGDLDRDTFNVPVIIGGTYIYSPDLQFIFGISVDYERNYPVFPGGGIRWHFASQWTLNAALPTPRLEYEMNRNLMIYAGADVKGTTFRVDENFGESRADTRLNNAILTYTELRVGAGLEWKITPEMKLSLEGGYLPYREFDYHRADIRYTHEEGAPYGSISLRAAF